MNIKNFKIDEKVEEPVTNKKKVNLNSNKFNHRNYEDWEEDYYGAMMGSCMGSYRPDRDLW